LKPWDLTYCTNLIRSAVTRPALRCKRDEKGRNHPWSAKLV
jgi:hypothetical protein